jgi:hypothetical protein
MSNISDEEIQEAIKRYIKKYIKSNEEVILRHVDMITLYIISFCKIFAREVSHLNENETIITISTPDAIREKSSYVTEYLTDIKEGFERAANGIVAISQDFNIFSFSLSPDVDNEYFNREITVSIIKTINDLQGIGRALGKLFYQVGRDAYAEVGESYYDPNDIKDRYLVEVLFDENGGKALLHIMTYMKLEKEIDSGNIT